MSTEKPGWLAARAEGRGSVKAVSTRGKDDGVGGGQAKASIPPLQHPRQERRDPHTLLDPEDAGYQLPTSLHLYTASVRSPCLPGNYVSCG